VEAGEQAVDVDVVVELVVQHGLEEQGVGCYAHGHDQQLPWLERCLWLVGGMA
jgi:hypothetical protein